MNGHEITYQELYEIEKKERRADQQLLYNMILERYKNNKKRLGYLEQDIKNDMKWLEAHENYNKDGVI